MKPVPTFLSILFTSILGLTATHLDCSWQDSGYPEGYYQPSSFSFELGNDTLKLIPGTYFFRSYEPCWISEIPHCAFAFEIPDELLRHTSIQLRPHGFQLRFVSLDGYGIGYLKFDFNHPIKQILSTPSMRTTLWLSGEDGSGTAIQRDRFSCQTLR